jgi:hypothetical protein
MLTFLGIIKDYCPAAAQIKQENMQPLKVESFFVRGKKVQKSEEKRKRQ